MSTESTLIRRMVGGFMLGFGTFGIPLGAVFVALFGVGIPLLVVSCALFVGGAALLFGPEMVNGLKGMWARRKEVKSLSDVDRVIEQVQKDVSKKPDAAATTAKTATPKATVTPPAAEKSDSKQSRSGPLLDEKKAGKPPANDSSDAPVDKPAQKK